MNLSEGTLKEEAMLLAHIDLIQKPSNSDLDELVQHLLNNRFLDLRGHPEAERLVRASLRLRVRYLLASSGVTVNWHTKLTLVSDKKWLNIRL